jgi:two-component system cell cycle response regulator
MGKARILAVDDQRYFRELIEGLLSDAGFDVQTVASGEEALQRLERDDFDIVLTDLVMPGMDGTELVRKIRERLPQQDVVMVTGVVDVKIAVDAMKQGATDYILKPFDRGALVETVGKLVERRRIRVEHARLVEENLEYMGVVSLFERATGLFSSLSVEPLAERLLEGLCLETRAQTGVVWLADELGSEALSLVGVRGLVRLESEPRAISFDEVEAAWCPGLRDAKSVVAVLPEDAEASEALFLPLRAGSERVGVVRLSDRLHGEPFPPGDRVMAEKFAELGGVAVGNAMRFRALERRSLRDPETRAYSRAYLDDAVRNEIHKANRFGHRFSLLRIDLDRRAPPGRPTTSTSRGPRRPARRASWWRQIESGAARDGPARLRFLRARISRCCPRPTRSGSASSCAASSATTADWLATPSRPGDPIRRRDVSRPTAASSTCSTACSIERREAAEPQPPRRPSGAREGHATIEACLRPHARARLDRADRRRRARSCASCSRTSSDDRTIAGSSSSRRATAGFPTCSRSSTISAARRRGPRSCCSPTASSGTQGPEIHFRSRSRRSMRAGPSPCISATVPPTRWSGRSTSSRRARRSSSRRIAHLVEHLAFQLQRELGILVSV